MLYQYKCSKHWQQTPVLDLWSFLLVPYPHLNIFEALEMQP